MIKYLAIPFLLCSIYFNISAQDIVDLESKAEVEKFQDHLYILEDKSKSYRAEDIIQGKYDSLFEKSTVKGLNFGFNQSVFWVKFQLKHQFETNRDGIYSTPTQWFLVHDYYATDSLILYYIKPEAGIERSVVGDMVPLNQYLYPYSKMLFPLEMNSRGTHTFYIKLHTLGSVQLAFSLKKSDEFEHFEFGMQLYFGLFYGSLLIMLVYNLFLYTAIRKITYIYYCGYILFYTLAQANITGHSYYLFLGEFPVFANIWSSMCVLISSYLMCLFSFAFLETASVFPRFRKIIPVFLSLILLSAFLTLFVPYNVHALYTSLLAVGVSIGLFVLGIITLLKGKKFAQYYTLGWFFLLAGALLYALKILGVVPNYFIFNLLPQVGAVFEALLLSVALADQINTYRIEKQKAQAESIKATKENERILAEQNKMLEEKVLIRTKELQEKQDEIVTQYEELMQQKDEILTQRDHIEEQNKVLVAKDRRIESSIKAAKIIQSAILPYQSKLESLLKNYFVINRPKDIVSGDFYWLNQVEDSIILALADCTGHGVQGAFMTLIGNTLLDKIIRVWDIHQPAAILNRLHEEVERVLSNEDQINKNNGMDIVVISWKPIDEDRIKLTYSAAKRPLYYIEPSAPGVLKELKGTRRSIGGSVQNAGLEFEEEQLILEKGTYLYMFSDGFVDQNNSKRKRLGEETFRKTIMAHYSQPMHLQKQALEKLLDDYMFNTSQRDDILVVGFQLS